MNTDDQANPVLALWHKLEELETRRRLSDIPTVEPVQIITAEELVNIIRQTLLKT